MMDTTLASVMKIAGDLGLVALVVYMWWSDDKRIWMVIDQHKKDMAEVLERYQRDMAEQREMYRANASLCRDFTSIATDLRDIVTLNIRAMTQMDEAVRSNQFCPVMRIRNKKTLNLVPMPEGGGG
jgi:hypothetical protein